MATGVEESLALTAGKAAISALVKPVATAAWSGVKKAGAIVVDVFSDRLTDYVDNQMQRHSCLSTIVFGHQKSLHELYVPLTVAPVEELRGPDSSKGGLRIDRFKNDFLPKHNRVLITDTAGMGKSTLSKFLFLQCIKSAYAVPFFIELRHLSTTIGPLQVILRQLNPSSLSDSDPKVSKAQLEKLLRTGGLVFFFDGYDEISPEHREPVTRALKDLVELYPDNCYVITSRPESGLLAFPAFKQFGIRPLTKEESFDLIRRYDEGGGRAEQLIEQLKGRDLRSVHEFLKNPLLTSLLYRSFEYKQSVPIKKHVFYRQVFDALFDWHDSTKDGYNTREKKSGLDIDTFHRMLRVVGFVSVMTGKVEGDTDTVLGWIRRAKEVCKLATPESSFLEDCVRAVPVFVKDGDYYRWSHKSLSEYFAAQYICTEGKAQQARILGTVVQTQQVSRFYNVLDQIYDIDQPAFREYLLLPAAQAFRTYWANAYNYLDPAIPASYIAIRRACTFDRTVVFVKDSDFVPGADFKKDINDLIRPIVGREISFDSYYATYIHSGQTRTRAQVMIELLGPYAMILTMLEAKRDPIAYKKGTLPPALARGWRSSASSVALRTGPRVLNDDPKADFNLPKNFALITGLVLRFTAMADPEKLLAFESNFNDAQLRDTFADNILASLGGS